LKLLPNFVLLTKIPEQAFSVGDWERIVSQRKKCFLRNASVFNKVFLIRRLPKKLTGLREVIQCFFIA
jgi:uncharacterized protein (DUF1015 family)